MSDPMMQEMALQQAADAGRSTDTVLAHLTLGEVVIPREIMEDPEASQMIMQVFQAYGIDPREFTVGDPANKINPETGYPEFFFKKIKKVFKKVAPIVGPILGTMIPGVGTALGAAIGGGLGGLASGGGFKGALQGAALGGLGGSLFSGLGGAAAQGATGASSLGGGLGASAAGGGSLLGSIKGALSSGLSSLTQATGGGGVSGLGNLTRIAGSLYGASEEDEAAKKARNAALGSIQPYNQMGLEAQQKLSSNLAAGFNPGDLSQDAGYQFRLKQGQDALNASLAAQGLGQSGAALKAAQEYGQGFAQNEYSNAYDRWLSQNQQLSGLGDQGFAGAVGAGDVMAQYEQQKGIAKQKRLAELLAGFGYGPDKEKEA